MNTRIFNKVEFEADKKNDGLKTSPWSGHRNFAYDLVTYMKPKRIVELGTHYGCSFFSFLQACKDQHLDTEVIAIDCWEGDPQAGFYGDEVFSLVKETVGAFFKKQNKRLIKKYFDEALSDVEDESVDILHIDGLHTYEAVSNDYKNWLPKLKNNGIVLFHDVESSLGYGTNKFWEEMQKINPYNYTFNHSWGLGVLFPKGEKYYEEFEDLNMKDKILIYEYRAKYELATIQLNDHKKMIDERDSLIKKNEEMIQDRDATIKSDEKMIRDRDDAIKENEKMIQDRDATIKSDEKMIQDRDEAIKANEKMIQERDSLIKKYELEIDELKGV